MTYRALICLKETVLQAKKSALLRRASKDKTSQGRKHYLLTIAFPPDSTTCTCNFCQDKMQKGLCKTPIQGLTKKIFVNKCIKWPISTGKGLGFKLDSRLHGEIYFRTMGWLSMMSQFAKLPTLFLTHTVYIVKICLRLHLSKQHWMKSYSTKNWIVFKFRPTVVLNTSINLRLCWRDLIKSHLYWQRNDNPCFHKKYLEASGFRFRTNFDFKSM